MSIKNFKKFDESVYSMAARVGPSMFSKPATNRDYTVDRVLITFPDATKLVFKVLSESYDNDKVNYTIGNFEVGGNNRYAHFLREQYLKIFGNEIQMENYQEFVFVRCWATPGDFIDNDWEGYIFKGEKGFNEIEMKFQVSLSDGYKHFKNNSLSDAYFANPYLSDTSVAIKIVSQYLIDLPNGIEYKKLIRLKRKFQSWMTNDVNEYHNVDLFGAKIDHISLISVIYALQLKDKSMFENLIGRGNRVSYQDLVDIKPSKILDLFYKD